MMINGNIFFKQYGDLEESLRDRYRLKNAEYVKWTITAQRRQHHLSGKKREICDDNEWLNLAERISFLAIHSLSLSRTIRTIKLASIPC